MTNIPAGNRKKIAIDENDVALIFKENGHVDLSFPEVTGENVPEHVMAALALSYAVVDEEFFAIIQDRFAQQASMTLEEDARKRDIAADKEDGSVTAPHLKVVS